MNDENSLIEERAEMLKKAPIKDEEIFGIRVGGTDIYTLVVAHLAAAESHFLDMERDLKLCGEEELSFRESDLHKQVVVPLEALGYVAAEYNWDILVALVDYGCTWEREQMKDEAKLQEEIDKPWLDGKEQGPDECQRWAYKLGQRMKAEGYESWQLHGVCSRDHAEDLNELEEQLHDANNTIEDLLDKLREIHSQSKIDR